MMEQRKIDNDFIWMAFGLSIGGLMFAGACVLLGAFTAGWFIDEWLSGFIRIGAYFVIGLAEIILFNAITKKVKREREIECEIQPLIDAFKAPERDMVEQRLKAVNDWAEKWSRSPDVPLEWVEERWNKVPRFFQYALGLVVCTILGLAIQHPAQVSPIALILSPFIGAFVLFACAILIIPLLWAVFLGPRAIVKSYEWVRRQLPLLVRALVPQVIRYQYRTWQLRRLRGISSR